MSQQQSLEDAADMMGGNIRTRRDRIAGETFIADVNASTTLSLQLFKKNVLRCMPGCSGDKVWFLSREALFRGRGTGRVPSRAASQLHPL
jgi:hypothetical protein